MQLGRLALTLLALGVAPGIARPAGEDTSGGCRSCHLETDEPTMHASPAVVLGCGECHGGDATIFAPADARAGSPAYDDAKRRAHVAARPPEEWGPRPPAKQRSYTLLNRESPEFIRFQNPGDLRVAREACGSCHLEIIETVERSLMATSAMFWGGAAYNNGIVGEKRYLLGEAYTRDG